MSRYRRQLLAAVVGAGLAASWQAFAQPKDRLVRIGWLGNTEGGTPQARAIREALLNELQCRGWIPGRNRSSSASSKVYWTGIRCMPASWSSDRWI